MDFTSLFNMQGMMFCILALGWYLRKSGMIDRSGKALLSSLVMNVTLPASIVKSFQMEFSMDILKLTLEVIVISFLIQIFSNLLSRVLYPGWSEESKKVLQYATIVSNAGILGNAIAEGIFGDLGIMYAAVYTIPTRIFMWSVGLTYFTEAPTKKELLKKVVTHPCIIGIFYRHGTSGISVPASRICKPDSPDGRWGEHVLRDASDRMYARGNPV